MSVPSTVLGLVIISHSSCSLPGVSLYLLHHESLTRLVFLLPIKRSKECCVWIEWTLMTSWPCTPLGSINTWTPTMEQVVVNKIRTHTLFMQYRGDMSWFKMTLDLFTLQSQLFGGPSDNISFLRSFDLWVQSYRWNQKTHDDLPHFATRHMTQMWAFLLCVE